MKCREVEASFTEWLDGRLDAPAVLGFQEHLESCASCRAFADRWSRLQGALRPLAPAAPSAARLRRMEESIERARTGPVRASSPRRPLRWIGGATAALAAAAACLLFARRPAPFATVAALDGTATADGRPLGAGDQLGTHGTLTVDRGAVTLVLATGARIILAEEANLTLGGDAAHVALTLRRGRLDAQVEHRRTGESFVVSTTDGRVEVRGTRFSVGYDATGRSWVRVAEGRVVAFGADRAGHAVSAGEERSLALGEAARAPEAAIDSAAAIPAVTGPSAASTVRSGALLAKPRPIVDGAIVERARAAMRLRRYDEALALLETAEAERVADDEVGYLRAETLHLAGRTADAIRAYERLDRPSARPAARQNALVAAAQIEQQLAHHAAARRFYERALLAAPAGSLAEEAILGVMAEAHALHDDPAALAAARRYLQAYPTGLGAVEARRVQQGASAVRAVP